MEQRRVRTGLQVVMIVCCGMVLFSNHTLSQSASVQDAHPFRMFFDELAATQGASGRRGEAGYYKLTASIEMLTPAQISEGIVVVDRQLDSTVEPPDLAAKFYAAMLLVFISSRPDGPALMASQFDRLQAMLNDPTHSYSSPAAMALQYLAMRGSDLVKPILEAALKAPEVNREGGVGPGIATVLLRITHPTAEVTESVVQYMRRADLTDKQLIDTIIGISSSPEVPDGVVAELVRCLDRKNYVVKGRALAGIGRGSLEARRAAGMRIQKMAHDAGETAHMRQLAAEALAGGITDNPDVNK